ncbi:MAG: tRNA glutamyl-Q(34) synthetase GluQRS [Hyphomonadaceae bacterium]|nr:tRNA glutamyl-Q(34) synthetase GluQRS [Hyphomonadaceae bacterium]
MTWISRFAPSPTGWLHLGHAFSALLGQQLARASQGIVLLRLEDIDAGRCRPEYERGLLEDLAWLGAEFAPPLWRQSQRLGLYRSALDSLIARGLAYRCFRTRKQVLAAISGAPHGPARPFRSGALPAGEEARRLAAGEEHAWRLDLEACRKALGARWEQLAFVEAGRGPGGEHGRLQAAPERLGDVVLARKDYGVGYHLAACHDDAAAGVTHVIRGEDLHEAAHLHVLLQALFDWPTPTYVSHPLVLGEDGRRLAKRNQAATLRDLRAQGVSPQEVRARLSAYFKTAASAAAS